MWFSTFYIYFLPLASAYFYVRISHFLLNKSVLHKIKSTLQDYFFSSVDLELGLNIISGVRTTAKIVF